MAARATWKGFLKISLVNIPIKVFPATESAATISFNQLHGECQTRIQQKRWCPHCDREVPNSEIVKGYEFEKGRYVVMSRGGLRQGPARVDARHRPRAVRRRQRRSIRCTWTARTTSRRTAAMAADAFAVMRDGMKGKVGIGKLALYGREYLVAVRPHERGIVMHTLHHAAEIRGIDAVEELNAVPAKVKPEEMKLARQVIGNFEGRSTCRLQGRVPGGAAADHRREDRRRGGGRDRRGGAAEGRQPDGRPAAKPRSGQRRQEEDGKSGVREAREGRRRAAEARRGALIAASGGFGGRAGSLELIAYLSSRQTSSLVLDLRGTMGDGTRRTRIALRTGVGLWPSPCRRHHDAGLAGRPAIRARRRRRRAPADRSTSWWPAIAASASTWPAPR